MPTVRDQRLGIISLFYFGIVGLPIFFPCSFNFLLPIMEGEKNRIAFPLNFYSRRLLFPLTPSPRLSYLFSLLLSHNVSAFPYVASSSASSTRTRLYHLHFYGNLQLPETSPYCLRSFLCPSGQMFSAWIVLSCPLSVGYRT